MISIYKITTKLFNHQIKKVYLSCINFLLASKEQKHKVSNKNIRYFNLIEV